MFLFFYHNLRFRHYSISIFPLFFLFLFIGFKQPIPFSFPLEKYFILRIVNFFLIEYETSDNNLNNVDWGQGFCFLFITFSNFAWMSSCLQAPNGLEDGNLFRESKLNWNSSLQSMALKTRSVKESSICLDICTIKLLNF